MIQTMPRKSEMLLKASRPDFGRATLDFRRPKFNLGRATLDFGRTKFNFGRATLDFGRPKFNLERATLNFGRTKLNLGRTKLDFGRPKTRPNTRYETKSHLYAAGSLLSTLRYAQKRPRCAISIQKTLKSEIIHYFCKR